MVAVKSTMVITARTWGLRGQTLPTERVVQCQWLSTKACRMVVMGHSYFLFMTTGEFKLMVLQI